MERDQAIAKLISYALERKLIQPSEKLWAVNALLEVLELDGCTLPESASCGAEELPQVLDALLDDAYARGVLKENSIVYRDLFDTKLMGALTPRPAQVIGKFQSLREKDPKKATDWYYRFSQDTNYIRRDRIAKDVQWKTDTQYGELDITINLSKPEKDPKAIAAARNLPASNYPRCQLCAENEGYAGRVNHPARQNHRIVPITINGSPWFLQYSPYVYYNEHCICLNREHVPMKIDRSCFAKLLDFVGQFPHYFVGSNADLPIVGGSILAHDHFQGGRYTFAMEKAPVETTISFPGYEDVRAGIVKWPMSVIRLTAPQPDRLVDLILHNEVVPAVNQVETHPFCQQAEAAAVMASEGVQIESWAPFAEGRNNLFGNETLVSLAAKYRKSVAQVVLRWLIQRGVVCIPKSVHAERIAENFDVFGFALDAEDMAVIASLDRPESSFLDHRDPETVEWLSNLH